MTLARLWHDESRTFSRKRWTSAHLNLLTFPCHPARHSRRQCCPQLHKHTRHQRPGNHMLAQRTGRASVLVINELLAGGSASPNEHMPDHAGVAFIATEDTGPVKKKVEANSSLLPRSTFHKVKAQEPCKLLLCTNWIFFTHAQLSGHQHHSQAT